MKYKVSGAIAIPKASWGCAPALPNRIQVVFLGENFSQRNRSFPSGKRGFHPCFCLPACCNCPVALFELTTLILIIQLCLNWKVSKNAIAAGKTDCKIQFASQMWATRPHLGSIFVKLLHRKTFQLPAARISPPKQKSRRICCFAYPACFFSVQKLAYSVAFFFFFGITFSVSTPRRFCHQTHRLGTKQME